MNYSELARIAYHNYGSITDWKNYQGLPMPEYPKLPETIKQAWEAAVRSVVLELAGNSNYQHLVETVAKLTTDENKVTTTVDAVDKAEVIRIATNYSYQVTEKANADGTFILELNRVAPKTLKQQVEEQIAINEAEPTEQTEDKPVRKHRSKASE